MIVTGAARRQTAAGASLRLVDWADGSDPYQATARLLARTGRYAVSDSAWSMHLLGLQGQLPQISYDSMTGALPMLRAIKHGYGSDSTRTVRVGEPTEQEREVHDIVRRAQHAGFMAVRPRDRVPRYRPGATRVITGAGYGDKFVHRTGRGIGLTTPRAPIWWKEKPTSSSWACASRSNPASISLACFGVRIEDIVTVTADGGRRLNNAPTNPGC